MFARRYRNLRGFKSVTYLVSDRGSEFVVLSLWESREDAEAGGLVIQPQAYEVLVSFVKGPPTTHYLEVYEPKE